MTDSLQESLKIASRKFDQWKKRMQEAGYMVFGENAFKRKKDETSPSGYRDVFVTNYDKDIRKNSYGNLPASVGPKEKAYTPTTGNISAPEEGSDTSNLNSIWNTDTDFTRLLKIPLNEEGKNGISESKTSKQKLQVNPTKNTSTENTSTDLRGQVVWGADEKYPLKIGGKKTSSIQKKLIDAGFSAQQLANKMEDHKDWKAARR